MQELLGKLKDKLADISNISRSMAVLGWDQQTYMPPAAAESRGNQLALLGKLAQEMSISPELGKLIDELKELLPNLRSRF